MTETWTDTEKLVYHTIWKFVRRYYGHNDTVANELLERAPIWYVDAYYDHDPRRQEFTKYLQYRILKECLEWRRRAAVRYRILRPHELEGMQGRADGLEGHYNADHQDNSYVDQIVAERQARLQFDLDEFKEKLTDDGAKVVRMAFRLEERMTLGEIPISNLRSRLRRWLENIGWTVQRINESFKEIKEAL